MFNVFAKLGCLWTEQKVKPFPISLPLTAPTALKKIHFQSDPRILSVVSVLTELDRPASEDAAVERVDSIQRVLGELEFDHIVEIFEINQSAKEINGHVLT